MTGSEVKRIRRRLGLTQPQFAKLLGCHPVTLARWEIGSRRVSGTTATLLRLLAKTTPKRVSKPGQRKGGRQ
jgi:DNA-binding transcriptional regulator YiaG